MGRMLAAVVSCALIALAASGPAWDSALAQTAKKAPAKAKPAESPKSEGEASSAALKDYDAGVKAWQGGKSDTAVEELSKAINSSKLPQQQMARALYYRGLANRKLAKPAQAISDLQSALWLKGALTDAERNEAMAARSAAYREAGISDPQAGKASESANRVTDAKPVAASPEAAPQPPNAPAQTIAASASGQAQAPAKDWATAVHGSGRPAAASAATASVATVSASTQAPAAPTQPGSFLSSLFGGGFGSSTAQPEAPERRATPPHVDEDPDKPKPWGTAQVRPAAGASRVAGVVPPATTVSTAASASATPGNAGAFRLQVAAVASKADAEKIAAKFKKEQPKAVAQRAVDIDQADSTWRVRVGPYVSANEPRNLCVKLRQSGYDCMVVTQ